jgi:hypothetical protein
MKTYVLRFLLLACLSIPVAGLAWLLRDVLFHPVDAICVSGKWVDGGTKRGFAILQMQYEWDGSSYITARDFGPLDDSPRLVTTPADLQRARDWIAAECRPQPVWIMHGQPAVAWFRDERGRNTVIAQVVVRWLLLAALVAGVWTLVRRRHG